MAVLPNFEDNRRILVVDDDPAIQEFVSIALMGEGHQVITASDGITALAQAQQSSPSLILLDLRMPHMDGRSFIEHYHATPGPHAPIIVLTAGRSTTTSALPANIAGFLAKPFDLNALLEMVSEHMNVL